MDVTGKQGLSDVIRCTPRGICSWGFLLEGDGHRGEVAIHMFGEQGEVLAEGKQFDVCKDGWWSGRWRLSHGGQDVVTAEKPGVMSRKVKLQSPMGALTLEPTGLFGRSMELVAGDRSIATIAPVHAFTRRATIALADRQADVPTIYFAFWLVAMTWRRQHSSS